VAVDAPTVPRQARARTTAPAHSQGPWATIGVAVGAVTIALVQVHRLDGVIPDDAYITFRYARNIADGHGWAYNPGMDTTNAATSFLWTSLLAASGWLTGSIVGTAKVLYALCLAGAGVLMFVTLRRYGAATAGVAAAALLVSAPWLWSVTGMECGLLLLLVAGATAAVERPALSGALAGLACFARSEAALFVAALGIMLWAWRRRPPVGFGVGVLVAAVPMLVAAAVATGSAVPRTLAAKLAQARSGLWGDPPPFLGGFETQPQGLGIEAWWWTVVALATVGLFVLRDRLAWVLAPIVAFAMVLTGLYAAWHLPGYDWYYAPAMFAALVLAAVAVGALARLIPVVGPALLVAAVLMVGLVHSPEPRRYGEYEVAAAWLEENTRPSATVAATEIGVLGWHLDRPIVDYLGLLDERAVDELEERDVTSWLERTRPDFWLLHDPLWHFEAATSTDFYQDRYSVVFRVATPESDRTNGMVVAARRPG
jgi:arabinofuranosyltransferase